MTCTREQFEVAGEDEREYQRPWHLQVNLTDPHQPMDVTEPMHGWFRGEQATEFPMPVDPGDELSPETHTEIRRNYSAKVKNID